jgi:hypothetical protein
MVRWVFQASLVVFRGGSEARSRHPQKGKLDLLSLVLTYSVSKLDCSVLVQLQFQLCLDKKRDVLLLVEGDAKKFSGR